MSDDNTFTGWRTSSLSFSNGNCVEAGTWRKSSHSGYNNSCLEAGSCSRGVAVRDTKNRGGPVLTFSASAWREFAAGLKAA